MERWEYEQYYLRSLLGSYQQRLEETKTIIADYLQIVQRPYIAFSCGKDSSVLAHLVLSQDNTVPLRFLASGETRIVHNVDTVIDWFQKEMNAQVQEILIDRVFAEEWKDATWTEQRKAGRGDLERLNEGDWDGIFMGLRAEESNPRQISLFRDQTKGLPPFCYRYRPTNKSRAGIIRCCPLAKWSVDDIGAYLVTHDIPVLRQYHSRGLNSRTTARLTGDAVRQYVLSDIKRDNPEGWRKLVRRFPEFRAFV